MCGLPDGWMPERIRRDCADCSFLATAVLSPGCSSLPTCFLYPPVLSFRSVLDSVPFRPETRPLLGGMSGLSSGGVRQGSGCPDAFLLVVEAAGKGDGEVVFRQPAGLADGVATAAGEHGIDVWEERPDREA